MLTAVASLQAHLLQNLNQDDVQFVQCRLFSPEGCLITGEFDDQVRDVVLDTLPLLIWQGSPSILYCVFEDLQTGRQGCGPAG